MAEALGSAVLTLTVDDRQYNAGLQRAKQNADKTLGSVKGPSAGAGLTALTGGLTAAAVGAAAVTAAVVGIGAAAVGSAGSVQRLTAAFTGLTGSAEAAAQLRQQLFDLSKTTPFRNEEILQAAQRFLAVGVNVESLNGTINRVGTLAAQSGQSLERLALIYAQVYAKGRLQGEENLQLLEAGVDLTQELSQVTGLSGRALQDAMSKGQIGIDAFNKALVLATGDMKALQQAGKAVDVQFNNIGDNLGQLFGGFAQAISPALSAAFKVINDIFDAAFPDLESITAFFAPLTEEAQKFADVLGSSPGTIEIIAAGLKSLGGVIIKNIADGIAFVRQVLEGVDQQKFIQGFIDAEIVVRRLLLASSALGTTLVKNSELTFRAASNPLQFGKDILAAGGFAGFIEKEYALVEQKWNDWSNSEPLKFPDLTGKAAKQADQIAGNLSSKGTGALQDLTKVAQERAKAEQQIVAPSRERLSDLQATLGLEGAALEVAKQKLAIDKARAEEAKAIAAYDTTLSAKGFNADDPAVIDAAARVEAAGNNVRSALIEGGQQAADLLNRATQDLKSAVESQRSAREGSFDLLTNQLQQQLLSDARTRIQAGVNAGELDFRKVNAAARTPQDILRIAGQADSLVNAQTAVAKANAELKAAIDGLSKKDWAVNVKVNADGTYQAYGDTLNSAVGAAA